MSDCHGAGDNFYKARSFQEIYLNLFVFYFYLSILAQSLFHTKIYNSIFKKKKRSLLYGQKCPKSYVFL